MAGRHPLLLAGVSIVASAGGGDAFICAWAIGVQRPWVGPIPTAPVCSGEVDHSGLGPP